MVAKIVAGCGAFLVMAVAVGLAIDQSITLSAQGGAATTGAAHSTFNGLPLVIGIILVGFVLCGVLIGALALILRNR